MSRAATGPVCPAALSRDDISFLDRLVLELGVVQVRVHPAGRQQLLVATSFYDAAVGHHEDLVGTAHSREPVRDHD